MSVLKKPLITEKLTAIAEKHKQYGFVVDKNASKPQIKIEIERMYKVEVTSVSTMVYAGKRKAKHTKAGFSAGRNTAFKKAIVKLKEGQSIDFFENI